MASYKRALEWIALNDDTEWLALGEPDCGLSVTAALVADLFGKDDDKVRADLKRTLNRIRKEH